MFCFYDIYTYLVSEQRSPFQENIHSVSGFPIWHSFNTLRNITSFQSHKEAVTAVAVAENKQFVVSVGQDSLLKMYSISEKRQMRSVTLSSMPLSSCIIMPDDKTLIIGSWDNNM
jgi:factor associated with neutral sphingomyelinase activation